jgi:hypothetical protein
MLLSNNNGKTASTTTATKDQKFVLTQTTTKTATTKATATTRATATKNI